MESSVLGRLPPELRNKIYEHAFENEIIEVADDTDGDPTLPPLLRTCTRIQREGELVFFERARLVIETLDHYVENAICWLEHLQSEQA